MRFGHHSSVDNQLDEDQGFRRFVLTEQEARRVCGARRRRYEE